MQAIRTSIPPTIFETFPRAISASRTRQFQSTGRNMTDAYKIQSTDFASAPGVNLSDQQRLLTGSVLDLFSGFPTKRKLTLWKDDAVFADPITIAEGRKQFEPQWYGLKAVMSNIERLGVTVTSGGNPIEMDLKTRYTIKGLGNQQTVDSKVLIHTEGEGDGMRVKKVEDKWNGEMPEGAVRNALRNLNSVTVPKMVSVPASVEEEERGQ